jgi:ribonucleoside-diphosphate reductase alpha chain
LQAREIFDLMVKQAWRNGEPGIIFIDRINRDNPTPQLGDIESTNPCGEQPLLPNEPCNLGSINVSRMVKQESGQLVVDWDRLRTIVHRAVRFLDNVIDANRYPLPAISDRAKGNRKIGLGVMGWHDLLLQVGVAYDSEEALQLGEDLMAFLDAEGKKASSELAATRGVFPNFEGSVYDRTGGPRLRNATVTTIAPTGTLSIIAGSSSGIEPLFAICYTRTVMDKVKLVEVNPHFERIAKAQGWYSPELMETITHHNSIQEMEEIPAAVRRVFVTAHDIKPEWHIRMQAAFQRHTDNAVSKTVNFPFEATEDDVREVFLTAYREGCKGVTIYRDRSRDAQVLSVERPAEAPAAVATRPGKIVPRKRPEVTVGQTEKLVTGCGNLYVTVNQDQEGLCEVFTQMGKCGGCAMSQLEATARLISLALRAGVEVESIVKHLRGIRCPSPGWQNGTMVLSCPDAIAIALSRHANGNAKALQAVSAELPASAAAEQGHATAVLDPALRPMGACPDCGGVVEFDGGCTVCRACGYSRCG